MERKYLNFIERKKLEIATEEVTFREDCIGGKTLFSLISSGTELNASYLDVFNWGYPKHSGYSAVFQVDSIGSNANGFEIGDIVFTDGAHSSYTVCNDKQAVKIPRNIKPNEALFARMAGITMATLSRTNIRPGEIVMVAGLGTVGFMAMQVYRNCGYTVIGVDPYAERCEMAKTIGFEHVFTECPYTDERFYQKVGLALECSGNEQAVLNCCNMARLEGEVSIVGVPWKKVADIDGFDILNKIFYNYLKVYSGWEMNLSRVASQFQHNTMFGNYKLAIDWISEGKLRADNIYKIMHYTQSQKAYDEICNKSSGTLSTIIDWRDEK